ncbi:MAG: tetratricopeptide repeat protein [Bdellovibrio sp.]|nr:tetratricopeptide repeat protein [Bdellovibrio sp.]
MLLIIFSLLMIAGCSSTPPKVTSEFSEDIEKEFQNVENSVFEQSVQVKYDETSDFYPQVSEEKSSVVSDETLDLTRDKETIEAASNEGPVGQAMALCYSSKNNEGFKILQGQAKFNQKNPTYYLALGNCYFLQAKYRMALLYYNKAREISPNFAPAINNIGVVHEIDNLHQNALSAYAAATKSRPLSSTPSFNQAQLLLRYNLSKLALPILEKLHQTENNKVEIILALANCYILEGRFGEAVVLFERAKDNYKLPTQQLLHYAYVMSITGKKNDARDILSDIDPADGNYDQTFYAKLKQEFGL